MKATQRRGNTKKADSKHVSIRVNKDQTYSLGLPYKGMADLGMTVKFSSAQTFIEMHYLLGSSSSRMRNYDNND